MIPLLRPTLDKKQILQAISKVLDSEMIAEGEVAAEFELALSTYLSRNVALVNSCTSAITLAAAMIGVSPGDEVITTPMTCLATNTPFMLAGGILKWADIDPNTGNVAAESIRLKFTKKTKCVVCVWWAGQPPMDFDVIRSDCSARGIPLVIDAAHAIGSAYKGESVATCGDYVCFSFQAVKQLTSGDGGALACSDLQRAKRLRWFGVDRQLPGRFEQDICEAGFKFHMNDISAAIGLTMLGRLPQTLSAHRALSSNYDANIDNRRIKKISRMHGQFTSSCWVYSMLAKDRDEFIVHMKSRGVETGRLHVRNDNYTCFSNFKCDHLPGVDAFDKELIHIPAGPHVSESGRQQIVEAVNDF